MFALGQIIITRIRPPIYIFFIAPHCLTYTLASLDCTQCTPAEETRNESWNNKNLHFSRKRVVESEEEVIERAREVKMKIWTRLRLKVGSWSLFVFRLSPTFIKTVSRTNVISANSSFLHDEIDAKIALDYVAYRPLSSYQPTCRTFTGSLLLKHDLHHYWFHRIAEPENTGIDGSVISDNEPMRALSHPDVRYCVRNKADWCANVVAPWHTWHRVHEW